MSDPITREEVFLAAAAGDSVSLPKPVTRVERYLERIAERTGTGGGSPDSPQNVNWELLEDVTTDADIVEFAFSFDKGYKEIFYTISISADVANLNSASKSHMTRLNDSIDFGANGNGSFLHNGAQLYTTEIKIHGQVVLWETRRNFNGFNLGAAGNNIMWTVRENIGIEEITKMSIYGEGKAFTFPAGTRCVVWGR